jgi:hypothetical protein
MLRLLCTRRHVPLDVADDYLMAWQSMRNAVIAAGGRAWIFRGAGHEDRFMEFIEWNDDSDSPLDDDIVADGMAQLGSFGYASSSDEWEET